MAGDPDPVLIDGAQGEGGGQILRTALSLSLCLGRSVHIQRIRANRDRPGLRPQHLTAVRAAAQLGDAQVQGAEQGSRELWFAPQRRPAGGNFQFDIGTAGSTGLVLQTLLPVLLTAPRSSELSLTGGTHNPLAPSFHFLAGAFLPLLQRLGPRISAILDRPGFYPAGGGRVRVRIEPVPRLQPLVLAELVREPALSARALLCRLPDAIGRRELGVLTQELGVKLAQQRLERDDSSLSPGNALILEAQGPEVTEVLVSLGERGVPAETVARRLVYEAQRYLAAQVPVGEHLADQLLLPLALAGGGSFLTLVPSLHLRTNLAVIQAFLPLKPILEELGPDRWWVGWQSAGG
jgi:RNA 3'-terminal phosphate cyclase (ATP)